MEGTKEGGSEEGKGGSEQRSRREGGKDAQRMDCIHTE